MVARVAGEVLGKSQSMNGPINLEVLEAENSSDDANEMKTSQIMRGKYRLTRPGPE
jgi:hypothetical protein